MNKSDFFYDLPHDLIAQHPTERRDASRLMCLERESGKITHEHFHDILSHLNEGDVLVLNDSRVLPARLLGAKATGAKVEILLLRDLGSDVWETLVKPGKRLRKDDIVELDGVRATIGDELEDGKRTVSFEYDHAFTFIEHLERIGTMPLPPYINERLNDQSRYQTVYAKYDGSAAAPTAGLHFTDELLSEIAAKGVKILKVTLHVGLGTFRPVKEKDVMSHIMHSERFCIKKEVCDELNLAKSENRRIIAVGTTSARTLEAVYGKYGFFVPTDEETALFIYPGYKFGAIDALLTNFHLPESTLIMLVSAFAGYEHTMNAYKTAVGENYRFFSFGDAMFIY